MNHTSTKSEKPSSTLGFPLLSLLQNEQKQIQILFDFDLNDLD